MYGTINSYYSYDYCYRSVGGGIFIKLCGEISPLIFFDFFKILGYNTYMKKIKIFNRKGEWLYMSFVAGFVVDSIIKNSNEKVHEHLEHCHHEQEVHVGCCNHEIDNKKSELLL